MTTELTDTELRVKCAEAMGWKDIQELGYEWWRAKSGAFGWSGRIGGLISYPGYLVTLPNYPSDPAAALTLVDKLREEGWVCEASNKLGYWFLGISKGVEYSYQTDPSFCRAICRAFLAVKGKEM